MLASGQETGEGGLAVAAGPRVLQDGAGTPGLRCAPPVRGRDPLAALFTRRRQPGAGVVGDST
jgi:hypothetical protein